MQEVESKALQQRLIIKQRRWFPVLLDKEQQIGLVNIICDSSVSALLTFSRLESLIRTLPAEVDTSPDTPLPDSSTSIRLFFLFPDPESVGASLDIRG
jgi:hypothetical protein